ncbi:phosphoglucomutase/phosphomannomutase family protein [Pseudanabaena sp. PCC 6802]|uniref:phosphoglucomutase/phosphomannomutase family protein n=1 Tax=Pseudanabaena sp. PCC 6802 TaxID=118173 RepID=UPI00034D9A94|nr:phosphoglucomutase/phosphomannomutase family protein [Pseudanabaena sp. PCC 6802]
MSATTGMQPPIHFGTDGWRGVIADEFTFARLTAIAPVAARVLADTFGASTSSNTVVVGYDRRFLSPEFAKSVADSLCAAGFDVQLAQSFAPTPAFSWAAYNQKALGALVITASHNPPAYSGLKIKGAFGGSVAPAITKQVESILNNANSNAPEARSPGKLTVFDPWASYCEELRSKVDLAAIRKAILNGELVVFTDVMHGAAATGLEQILEIPSDRSGAPSGLKEINASADPLFGGNSPEPLPRYIQELLRQMRAYRAEHPQQLLVGFVFDGDSDRIAAVDGDGNFLSTQNLIPILLEHLSQRRGLQGEFIKTISGSDLMPRVAALYGLPVYETPVGFKYVADRMLAGDKVLLGGEESGGIGYSTHIPERDALLSALYLLEALALTKQDLSQLYRDLQVKTGFFSHYDRIDKHLSSLEAKNRLVQYLQATPLQEIDGRKVVDVNAIDGFKFRLEDDSWLLVRFSGTEPVLRLYCEAATSEIVDRTLAWISNWVEQF